MKPGGVSWSCGTRTSADGGPLLGTPGGSPRQLVTGTSLGRRPDI